MSIESNKAAYRRFYEEILNKGNLAVADEVVDPKVHSHNPIPGQKPGLEGFKDAIAGFRHAFPDLHAKATDIIAEGDKVVARFVVSATHHGEFMGIAPTRKQIEYEEIVIVRFKDGKIIEHWAVADALAIMQQLSPTSK
jgi:predicted ester cyclase